MDSPIQFMVSLQPYIADIGRDKMYKGLEHLGIPGIPSPSEYLAEYCSLSVSTITRYCHICSILLFFFKNKKNKSLAWNIQALIKESSFGSPTWDEEVA